MHLLDVAIGKMDTYYIYSSKKGQLSGIQHMAEQKKRREKIKFHWESGAKDRKEKKIYIMEVAEWNQII